MPFRETCILDETVGFVSACLEGEETMTWLCQSYGISRQWGYELLRREPAGGAAGRGGAPPGPHSAPHARPPVGAPAHLPLPFRAPRRGARQRARGLGPR